MEATCRRLDMVTLTNAVNMAFEIGACDIVAGSHVRLDVLDTSPVPPFLSTPSNSFIIILDPFLIIFGLAPDYFILVS